MSPHAGIVATYPPNEANRACGRKRGGPWRWRPRHRICQPPSRNQSIPAQRTTTGASSLRHYPLPNYPLPTKSEIANSQLPTIRRHLHLSTSTRLRPFPTTARAPSPRTGGRNKCDPPVAASGRNKCDPPVSILGRSGLRPSRATHDGEGAVATANPQMQS